MALDIRSAQTVLENLIRDTILYALGFRLPQVASIAALRAVVTQGVSGTPARLDDDLITVGVSSVVTAFRWKTSSNAADNGATVVQPADVTGNGRWLAWTSPLRFSTVVGAASTTLDQITSGPLRRVVVLDKSMGEDEVSALINGALPAVVIETNGDSPNDMVMPSGFLWNTDYSFTVTVFCENLRGNREAAQGSDVASDPDPGANALDGFIKALLSGTALTAVVDDIRNVRVGQGHNWISELGQRRIARSRAFKFQVTESFVPAPGDSTLATDAFVQPQLTALNQQPVYDGKNYLIGGCAPSVTAGLSQTLSAGSAKIAGATVTYAGGSVTFPAYSDTYRDLLPAGTMTLISVTAGGVPPPVTATALRIGVTTTSSSQVVADAVIAQTQAPYGPAIDIPI